MNGDSIFTLCLADRVSRALAEGKPVVALETTVIAHGLPRPLNIETARAAEQAILDHEAVPAAIGIVGGTVKVGLSADEIEMFGTGAAPDGPVEKVNLSNMAAVLLRRRWGATTVAATMRIAEIAGVKVFSTGGIGGVHRGVADSFDISADMTALARLPLICVTAGAKSILDLPKTREHLETLGVPVVGFGTDEFPAFYSRRSGLPVDIAVDTVEEAARLAVLHWQSGGKTAVLVCAPVPEDFEIPPAQMEQATERALERAARSGIRGKALTPFLLSQVKELTEGRSLETNRALLINNAEVAARIAAALALHQGQ